MVQRIVEIMANYENRLREMQSVPRLSYGRRLLCTDGAPNRMFFTCLFLSPRTGNSVSKGRGPCSD